MGLLVSFEFTLLELFHLIFIKTISDNVMYKFLTGTSIFSTLFEDPILVFFIRREDFLFS